jgi:hypothetical protein
VGQRNGYVVPRQVAQVAERLSRRTDELATALARAITGGTPLHQSSPVDYFDSVVVSCAGTIRPIFAAIAAESTFDTREATELGAIRARQGMPLASLMESCRVGFVALGELVLAESAAQSDVGNDVVRALTAKFHAAQGVHERQVVGYREEQSRRLDNDETERSVLFDSLLHGWLPEPQGLWGLADALRLPSSGPYMVIAAELPAVAATTLPEIESKLRGVEVFSAWRLQHDPPPIAPNRKMHGPFPVAASGRRRVVPCLRSKPPAALAAANRAVPAHSDLSDVPSRTRLFCNVFDNAATQFSPLH